MGNAWDAHSSLSFWGHALDQALIELAQKYKQTNSNSGGISSLQALYGEYRSVRDSSLVDAVTSSAALNAICLSDRVDFSKLTPQMKEAFRLAYPNVDPSSLSECSTESLRGFLAGWKGKYFEVLVRDKLNAGEQVGSLFLESDQVAHIAESATQPGWDLQIVSSDGSIVNELQLKATESLSHITEALERYPNIEIVTTEEAFEASGSIGELINSGIHNSELSSDLETPFESILTDNPLEDFADLVLPALPWIIIVCSESRQVLIGKKVLAQAIQDGKFRAIRTAASMGVGAIIASLDGGILSIPATFATRICFDRHRSLREVVTELDAHRIQLQSLAPAPIPVQSLPQTPSPTGYATISSLRVDPSLRNRYSN